MLAGDGMSQVTKNLLDLTQRRNFYAGDLLSSVEILRNVTETFKRASYEPSSDDVQNFFQIISNLLEEENKEKWDDAQKIYPGAVELMQVIEDFIHIVGLGMKDFHNAYLMTGNLVASIQRLPAVSVMTDINFPMKGRKGMVDWARNSEDKVVIPKGLFVSQSADMEGSPVFILGTVLYKTLWTDAAVTKESHRGELQGHRRDSATRAQGDGVPAGDRAGSQHEWNNGPLLRTVGQHHNERLLGSLVHKRM
ncbi:hypothetical protein fugu_013124 [Takifugu bimaculatus]|uniref:AGRL2-4 GAIN subdomain A domain-containing protein n=1 Tax=Takifugu bimaculatus TaxID=433685 RepID=A0A4Z2C7B3_9TELE|nr:hypothetical protein fugu_013124 [Takifugu bimaculatus]